MTDGQRDLGERLGGLQASQDAMLASLERIEKAVTERLNDHSRRLRALELWRSSLAGVVAVLTAIWGWFIAGGQGR